MSSTTTDQQFIHVESSLPEPHFDEEATVLSARPVVPLDAVERTRTQPLFSRPWILGLGLIGALLVGIFATAVYFSRSNGDPSDPLQSAEIGSSTEENSAAANSFSGPAAAQPTVDDDSTAVVKKQTPAKSQDSTEPGKKPSARLVAVIRDKQANNQSDEESDDDRKAARKQARKERRRAERERREERSPDELFRIRDIFEGSPRP